MQRKPMTPRRVRVEAGIYRSPATGRLEIQYTDPTGRTRWRTITGDLDEARRERAVAQSGLRAKSGLATGSSFRDVATEWFSAQTHLRPRTRALYHTALSRHLYPKIGSQPIAAIDEDAIARVIAELHAQGLSGWTIRGILVPRGRVLAFAARRKLIADNPIRRLERSERPRVVKREMRILGSAEIDALIRAATPTYRPVLMTAIFTGLRQGELLGLRWADVDFETGLLRVRCQLDRSGAYVEPKTAQAVRSVVMMPSLVELLRQLRASSHFDEPSHPVFATATGRPLYYRNLSRQGLEVAVRKAGLDRAGEPRLRFHDLRHTYASVLIAQGLNILFISRQLGHASPSFTLDVYGGLFDRAEHAKRAIDALESTFASMFR